MTGPAPKPQPRRATALGPALRRALARAIPSDHVVARAVGRIENERFRSRVPSLVRRALSEVPAGVLPPGSREVRETGRTGTRVAVAKVGPPGGSPEAVVFVAQTAAGGLLLHRQGAAERALRADPRLAGWRHLVPEPVAEGSIGPHGYLVERALPGWSPQPWLADGRRRVEIVEQAATVIGQLHERTATASIVDEELLERWVRSRTRVVGDALGRAGHARAYGARLVRLERDLSSALDGRELVTSWIHGDCWPGNLLVDGVGAIVGIVDWDRAGERELPIHDILHLLLYTRRLVTGVEPGRLVRDAIDGDPWPPHERRILASAEGGGLPRDAGERKTILLLYWLRFVAATFEQSDYFARDPRWVRENVDPVLAAP